MISMLLVYRDYRNKTTRAKIANNVTKSIAAQLPRIRFSQINDRYTSTVARTTQINDRAQGPFAHNVTPHKDAVAARTTRSGRFMPNTASSGTSITPTRIKDMYDEMLVLFAQIEILSAFEQNTGVIINLSKASASSQITTPLTTRAIRILRKLIFENEYVYSEVSSRKIADNNFINKL